MAQREPLGRFEEATLTDCEGELALDWSPVTDAK
jgi:hypothetical protein